MERRFVELELTGRRLSGVVMAYNTVGYGPGGPERFEPRAFGDVTQSDLILNFQHDRTRPIARTGGGGLTLSDSNAALTLSAELPASRDGDDALGLVKAGVLRGLSLEFRATEERYENGVRIVSQATLHGVAVVDRPAHADSIVEARYENRARLSLRIQGVLPYGQVGDCACHRGECDKVELLRDSFKGALDTDVEILVIPGDYSRAISSRKFGSLKLKDTDRGLTFDSAIADTTAGRDLVGQAEVVSLIARPYFSQDASEFIEEGGVAIYSKMALRAIMVGASDAAKGWPPVALVEPSEPRHEWRRSRWL